MRMNAHRTLVLAALSTATVSCAAGSPADTYYDSIGLDAASPMPTVDSGKKDAASSHEGGGTGVGSSGSGFDADVPDIAAADDTTAPADDASAGTDGTTGSPGADTGGCASCSGCCDLTGACVPGVSDTQCGSGGGGCTDCTMVGGSCQPGGSCSSVPDAGSDSGSTGRPDAGGTDAGACSQRTCRNGCCDSSGACQPGNTTTACGQGGQRCRDCTNSGIQHMCGMPIPICL